MQNEFNIKKINSVMNHINSLKMFRIISDEVVSVGFPLCYHSQEVGGQRSSPLVLTWSIADQARDVLRALQA